MRSFVVALFFLSATAYVTATAQSNAKAKNDFITAMMKAINEEASKYADIPITGREERKAHLNQHLLANSFRAVESSDDFPTSRRLDDAVTFEFNVSSFSLKYVGCANLAGYSDELAAQYGYNVLDQKNYVSFRLCPSASCSDGSSNGCRYNYGEYLIPMDDYLQSISDYRQEDFQLYCGYCEQCMYFENYFYGNRRELGDHACKYYDKCYDYADYCTATDDDGGGYHYPTAYENYMTCQQVGGYGQNGKLYYAGPYCGSDHKTITIGLFSDEFCTDYIGGSDSVAKITGDNIDDSALSELYSGDCISCSESTSPYKIQADKDDNDDIRQVCSTVYGSSAKCEPKIFEDITFDEDSGVAYQSRYKYSYSDEAKQSKTCSYIEKVSKHQYDSYGVVHLDGENDKIYVKDSTAIGKMNRVKYDMTHASAGQKTAISFLVLGCVGLIAAAVVIYQKLPKPAPALASQTDDLIEASRDEAPAEPATGKDDILATRSSGTETWA